MRHFLEASVPAASCKVSHGMVLGHELTAHDAAAFLKLCRSGSGQCLGGTPPSNPMETALSFIMEKHSI